MSLIPKEKRKRLKKKKELLLVPGCCASLEEKHFSITFDPVNKPLLAQRGRVWYKWLSLPWGPLCCSLKSHHVGFGGVCKMMPPQSLYQDWGFQPLLLRQPSWIREGSQLALCQNSLAFFLGEQLGFKTQSLKAPSTRQICSPLLE